MVNELPARTVAAAALAVALAGCATAVDDPALYAAGWRQATLIERGAAESLISPETGLCNGAEAWRPGQPAVVVRFRSDDRFRLRRVTLVVPAAAADDPADGTVWVNLRSCRWQKAPPVSSGD